MINFPKKWRGMPKTTFRMRALVCVQINEKGLKVKEGGIGLQNSIHKKLHGFLVKKNIYSIGGVGGGFSCTPDGHDNYKTFITDFYTPEDAKVVEAWLLKHEAKRRKK